MRFVFSGNRTKSNFMPTTIEQKYCLGDIKSGRDFYKIKQLIEHKVPFYPPTMSPSESSEYVLESLPKALKYYEHLGHEQVIIQPKMMGSRCVVVLRQGLENCFAVSKNGWIIDHIDLDDELERLYNSYPMTEYDEIILDCELMPWSVMGKGLIDKNFYGYSDLAKTELNKAKEYGFEEAMTDLQNNPILGKFQSSKRKDFINDNGHHLYRTFQQYVVLNKESIPIDEDINFLNLFDKSLSNYDAETLPSIKPFALLRTVQNGVINASYPNDYINKESLRCNVKEIVLAESFRRKYNVETTEGMVVKPIVPVRDQAPYLKVRNPEYLRIVYGPDYNHPNKLAKLIQRKNIYHKLKRSIEEWNVCMDMLEGGSIEHGLCKLHAKPERDMDPRL